MKKNLTPFGEKFEELRFLRKQTLQDAAKALLISVAYLSAIIHGKRDIPFDFIDKMKIAYGLSEEEIAAFEDAENRTPRLRKMTKEELRAALINLAMNEASTEDQLKRAINKINDFLDSIK